MAKRFGERIDFQQNNFIWVRYRFKAFTKILDVNVFAKILSLQNFVSYGMFIATRNYEEKCLYTLSLKVAVPLYITSLVMICD